MISPKPPAPPAMPVPRDHSEASFSEMVPFRSTKIDLKKSSLMLFGVVTAIVTPMLFITMITDSQVTDIPTKMSNFKLQASLSVFYLLFAILMAVHAYARPGRPFWVFGIPFVVTTLTTAVTPLFAILVFPFRGIIPNIVQMGVAGQSFIERFFGMLMIAGFAEEWTKAIPVLVGAWLTWQVMAGAMKDVGFVAKYRVRGPLDGVLFGIFSGAGFIMAETAFEYVPNLVMQTAQRTGSWEAGVADALTLLIPRVAQSFAGHIGWSAIVGYAIGLAVIRPRSKWKLILGGWVIASVVHGLWNSVAVLSLYAYYVVAGVSVLLAIACLLKARQLDLAMRGPAAETGGSIIVTPENRPQPAPVATMPPVAQAPVSAPVSGVAQILVLDIEGLHIPLRANQTVDLSAEPALGGRGAGVSGVVVPHPTRQNVLGLRNSGSVAWVARLRDGSQQQIDRDQNIRLAPGVSIAFGNGLFGSVVARD